MTDDILVSTQDGISTVTFNRPRQRNAISYHGWLELRRIAMDLDRDPDVRVVMFTGAGDAAFSAEPTSRTSRTTATTPRRQSSMPKHSTARWTPSSPCPSPPSA